MLRRELLCPGVQMQASMRQKQSASSEAYAALQVEAAGDAQRADALRADLAAAEKAASSLRQDLDQVTQQLAQTDSARTVAAAEIGEMTESLSTAKQVRRDAL